MPLEIWYCQMCLARNMFCTMAPSYPIWMLEYCSARETQQERSRKEGDAATGNRYVTEVQGDGGSSRWRHPKSDHASGHRGTPSPVPQDYLLWSHIGVTCVTVSWWWGPVATAATVTTATQMSTVIPSIVATRILVCLVITSVIVLLVHTGTDGGNDWVTAHSHHSLHKAIAT